MLYTQPIHLLKWLLIFSYLALNFSSQLMGSPLKDVLPTISIIIDDIGDSEVQGLRATRLPTAVALSILPHTPFSHEIANIGHQRGMDILLHQPMESVDNIGLLGPGALLSTMDQQQFTQILEKNLNAVPFVIGLNNHMGSLLTTNNEKMNWVMAALKPKGIFFIDSRTTTETVAAITAKNWHIPTMSRKVFLDHYDGLEAIAEQFQRLLSLARKYGHATAIGHPKQNTLQFLEQNLPKLEAMGFKLVSLSTAMYTEKSHQAVSLRKIELPKRVNFYDYCYKTEIKERFNLFVLQAEERPITCAVY